MKIAFGLGHPAHFHLFKHTIRQLQSKHEVKLFISDKDILRKLLNSYNFNYVTIAQSNQDENLVAKARKLFHSTKELYAQLKNDKPDICISCISQLSWVSFFLKRKNIFNAEDDITYTYLQGIITYPFVNTILTSKVVKIWPFSFKRIGYAGYHKLAYLHPNWFRPDEEIKNLYIKEDHYFVIRIVNQAAYHDLNATGLDQSTLLSIIEYLKDFGAIYISSEKPLTADFEKYMLNIKEKDIHHILYFADLFIGDSQSMAIECAMLGTPSIRINNFANKISVIKELENIYKLTYSLLPNQKDRILLLIKDILALKRDEFRKRRRLMLESKIDVTSFYVWFIENYPKSIQTMHESPDHQYHFK